jgi:hypothetical protein
MLDARKQNNAILDSDLRHRCLLEQATILKWLIVFSKQDPSKQMLYLLMFTELSLLIQGIEATPSLCILAGK